MGRVHRPIRALAAIAALGAVALLGGCYVAPPSAGYGYYGGPAYAYSAPVYPYASGGFVTFGGGWGHVRRHHHHHRWHSRW
jgi:hypothetical protein